MSFSCFSKINKCRIDDPKINSFVEKFHFFTSRLFDPEFCPELPLEKLYTKERILIDEKTESKPQEDDFIKDVTKLSYRKCMLLYGPMGCGKSTFLQYLFNNNLEPKQIKNGIFLDMNEITFSTIDKSVIYEKIKRVLNEFHLEILRFINNNKSSSEDPNFTIDYYEKKFLPNDFEYIGTIESKIIVGLKFLTEKLNIPFLAIILDNSDQCTTDDSVEYLLTFLQIIQRSKNTKLRFIFSIRDYNFFIVKARKRAHRNYNCISFPLNPPNFRSLLFRRIEFLFSDSEIHQEFENVIFQLKGNKIHIAQFEKEFIEKFFNIITGDTPTKEAINEFSNRSTRTKLLLLGNAVQSPHIDMDKLFPYLFHSDNEEWQRLPFNVFMHALILSSRSVFLPQDSCVDNVFSADQRKFWGNTFIKYNLLKFLYNSEIEKSGLDYKTLVDLFTDLYALKRDESKVKKIIEKCLTEMSFEEHAIITSDDTPIFDDIKNKNSVLKLDFAGHYYVNNLIFSLEYLQIVLDDMEIEHSHIKTVPCGMLLNNVLHRILFMQKLLYKKYLEELSIMKLNGDDEKINTFFELTGSDFYDEVYIGVKNDIDIINQRTCDDIKDLANKDFINEHETEKLKSLRKRKELITTTLTELENEFVNSKLAYTNLIDLNTDTLRDQ